MFWQKMFRQDYPRLMKGFICSLHLLWILLDNTIVCYILIYIIFTSIFCWKIEFENVTIPVKVQYNMRWESWINIVKPLCYHLNNIRNDLTNLQEKSLRKRDGDWSNIGAWLYFYLELCLTSSFGLMFLFRWTKWITCCSLLKLQLTLWYLCNSQTIAKIVLPLLCQ